MSLIGALLFGTACLSNAPGIHGTGPAIRPALAGGTATASALQTAVATIISQPQPGATGLLMTGDVTLNGKPPPAGSTLFLGLVKSTDDTSPRTCIDPERNPVDDAGQFYAQVACTPQPGDQLLYTLIVGRMEDRDWHRGVIPMPKDLSFFTIDAQ